jgi:hypothetical protein
LLPRAVDQRRSDHPNICTIREVDEKPECSPIIVRALAVDADKPIIE